LRRILVIESSATLRHVIIRLLRDRGFEVVQAASSGAGLEWLRQGSTQEQYDALIIGWPKYASADDELLLQELNQADYASKPIVMLCDDEQQRMHTWVSARKAAALLFWHDYSDIQDIVSNLIQESHYDQAGGSRTPLEQIIRILFVDDSLSVRTYYQRLLTRNGYEVELACQIDEAFDKAQEQHFDIAIIDYFMPGGNGDELCRRLRANAHTAQITSAIFTGAYVDKVIQEALEAGAVECMFKNEVDQLFLARISAMSRLVLARKTVDAERKRLESILGSVGEGVYGVNRDGRISFVNAAAMRILGYLSNDVLIDKLPHKTFHHSDMDGNKIDPQTCRLVNAYTTGAQLQYLETVFWNRDNEAIPVECTVYPLIAEKQVRGSVVAFRDISVRKSLENRLRWQATHDSLTELYNRRYLEEQLDIEVTRLKRSEEYAALLYIDLDRFKYINDTAGHAAGDSLLIEVSRQLILRLRDSDVLARLGGDEFAVILRNIEYDSILDAAESFRDLLTHCSFHYQGKSYKINGSIGVAIINKEVVDSGEILANADFACNLAKTKGRNQTHIYRHSKDEKSIMDLDLGWSARLREALQNDLFVLNYQPIIELHNLSVERLPKQSGLLWQEIRQLQSPNHFEVLVRLPGSNGDLISPHAFIPTAERFNLMQDIDTWVLEHAMLKLAQVQRKLAAKFSINLSGHSMGSHSLAGRILAMMEKYQIDPHTLIFEITETSAIENLEIARSIVKELKERGCQFALDDFGTGFSSFSQLKHLAVDYIKIDGSFVQGMSSDQIDQAMVASINDIAHSLGRKTVAEFVESADVLRLLRNCGVDYVQGHYISEPMRDVYWEEANYQFVFQG